MFIEIITDKIASRKVRETSQQNRTEVDKVERKQSDVTGTVAASSYSLAPSTLRVQQPKPDATDRRQIDAINEEKSHTTKETLDDIERIHHKEKAKKEQIDAEGHQTETNWVRKQ